MNRAQKAAALAVAATFGSRGIAARIRTTKKYAMKKLLAGLTLALTLSIGTTIGAAAPASADELIAANTYLC